MGLGHFLATRHGRIKRIATVKETENVLPGETEKEFPVDVPPSGDSVYKRYSARTGLTAPALVYTSDVENLFDLSPGVLNHLEEYGAGPRPWSERKVDGQRPYALSDVQAWWDVPEVRYAVACFQYVRDNNLPG